MFSKRNSLKTSKVIQTKMDELENKLGLNSPNGMPEEEMSEFELQFAELKHIEWILVDMHATIEGGEAREDFETTAASHHFTEIDDYLAHRIQRVRLQIESLFVVRNIFESGWLMENEILEDE